MTAKKERCFMPLRGKPPEQVAKRLKMFMFGPAGVGKTTAAAQFPNSYIIDCEKGAENYDKLITASKSVVFQTTDIAEVVQEVKTLHTEKHNFRTLVIDPITPVYNDLLDRCEHRVGESHGKHYAAASKEMKRLFNLILALDMNVIVTAHGKNEYGNNMAVIGQTFDAWKKLDYWFDLVVELNRRKGAKNRVAKVVKTRLEAFPDQEEFEWSYASLCQKYSTEVLEREAGTVVLASDEQVTELCSLLDATQMPQETVDKWLDKAGVSLLQDMPASIIEKCIAFVKSRSPKVAA